MTVGRDSPSPEELLPDQTAASNSGPQTTITPGVLVVASAFPDPPFDVADAGARSGLDVELMRAICQRLGLAYQPVRFMGDDFNAIFDGLAARQYDAVISGTTITPERQRVALFSKPYAEFNQALVVNRARTPSISSTDDLHGQTVGIQVGNTSDMVARRLLARGAIASIKYYPYHGILDAVEDLAAGRIGALIKLFPVARMLVSGHPNLAVVQQIPTHEQLGIAVEESNAGLCDAINEALDSLKGGGALDALIQKWIP
jgi:ABC-type amino acid transport substrate-binding protein